MSFSDYISAGGKKICKDHYINLVQVSMVDGVVNQAELNMLHKLGRKFGLTDPEIDRIIESEADHQYNPPYSLKGKFIHLYNIAQMILADGEVPESQIKVIRRFAIEAGFNDETIERLIELLFEGIRNDIEEDELFVKFRQEHLFRE